MKSHTNKNYFKYIIGIFFAVLIVLGIVAINSANQKLVHNDGEQKNILEDEVEEIDTVEEAIEKPKIPPAQLRLNTVFFGDVFWGRYVDDWSKASPLSFAYPFSGLDTFEKNKEDVWIAGLECPITSTYLSSKEQDSTLKFSCPVEYTPEAAKWFEAFTLANNHTDNMEEVDGFAQTKANLEKNGIQYFGHYDNSVKKDICEVLSFRATNIYSDPTHSNNDTTAKHIPIAMCGFQNIFRLPKEDELQVITEYAKYFPTIALPHQGKEYTYKADSLQQTYNRRLIDLGADAVIGNHVHSVQNTEAYKGKLIIYSLGNFIFDQQFSAQVTQAIGANLDFLFENDSDLQKYLEFSESCKQFQDSCLEQAKSLKLNKPKFSIKYDIIGSDNSKKLTKKASDAVFQGLKTRTNWERTKAQLE